MSLENPLWGAPRIHGELLKLGFEVALSLPQIKSARIDGSALQERAGPQPADE
jgi:hypothetical protein